MPYTQRSRKRSMVTFRVEPEVKRELSRLAKKDKKSLAALMRELAHKRIETENREEYEAEARRQSLEIAERARTPDTDDHRMMRELEGDLEWFFDEPKS